MENRFVTIAGLALLIGGIAGCSSSPPSAPERPPGALPPQTAEVTVDAKDAVTPQPVKCEQAGSELKITTGDEAAGMTALVDQADTLTAKLVTIRNLGGFTGSYWQDLGPTAEVSVTGRTYSISGTADGFNTDNPSFRTTETFAVKFAC